MLQEYKSLFPSDTLGYVDKLYNFYEIHGFSERNFMKTIQQGRLILDQITTFMNGRSDKDFYKAHAWKNYDPETVIDIDSALATMLDIGNGTISLGRPYDRRGSSCIPNVIWEPNSLPIVCKVGNATSLINSSEAFRALDKPIVQGVGIWAVPHQLHLLPGTKLGMLITKKIEGRPMTEEDWNKPHWLLPLVLNEVQVWFDSYATKNHLGAHGGGTSPMDYTSSKNAIIKNDGNVVIIDADMRTLTGKSLNPNREISGDVASELYAELLHIGSNPLELGMTYHAHEKRLEFPLTHAFSNELLNPS